MLPLCVPPSSFFKIRLIAMYCYSRNGTTLLNEAFQPCNNATKESACCMTNHSGAGHVGIADDKCMDNGLCQNFAANNGVNEGQQVWGIQGCTDPLWNSPYCLGGVCDAKRVKQYMLLSVLRLVADKTV